jgi:hypothetical protein
VRGSDSSDWRSYDDFSKFASFANLQVLARPMSVHDGEDQKDLSQPNMHFIWWPDPGDRDRLSTPDDGERD